MGKQITISIFFGSFYFLTNQGLFTKKEKKKRTKIKFVPICIAFHAGSHNYMQNNMTNNYNMKKNKRAIKKKKVGIKTVYIKGFLFN